MNEDHIRDLFDQVTELPPGDRTAYLREACGDDAALHEELKELLAADADAGHEARWQRSAIHNEALAEQAKQNAVGEVIGHYRLVELIGKGGMGAVYRAVRIDAEFDKCVAVKLIDAIFHSSDVIAHFRAERQILAGLEHPNIARLLDGGTRADGMPYLIMEYIEGISPADFCLRHKLSIPQRLQLFRQICSAVHFAHQHMVIHRDLKPANILVTEDGTPKLLDFGIAKVLHPDPLRSGDDVTEPGMLKLTARYASPEQIRGEPVTTASDVYSLGVVLYELLSGHSPYGDGDRPTHQLMTAVCDHQPARPSSWEPRLKGDLDNVILKALRKLPGERYASADQFAADILRHLEQRPVQARGEAPMYIASKFVRRNRVAVAASGVVLCALIGGLIEVSLARMRADRRFDELHHLAHSVIFDYSDAIDRLPGATPVRERLVKDALTYLDSLSKEADTPELKREIVDAYVRVSNVQGNEYQSNLGNTAGALASAQKAVAGAEILLRHDRSLQTLDSAAAAFSTDGSLLYSSGDLPHADAAYQRALGLREEIAQHAPADVQNQIALATILSHLGDLYGGYGWQNLGRTAESLGYYNRAKAVVIALSQTRPNDVDVTKERYETLLSVSASEGAAGRHDEAAKDLADALAQIEKVSLAQPHDTNVRYELANAASRLGQIMLDGRNAAAALSYFAHSATLLQDLLNSDTKNATFRRAQSIVEAQWAAALRGAGQFAEGVKHNEKALSLAQNLSRDAPKSTQYRIDVGISERKFSDGLLAASDAMGALKHAQQAATILCVDDPAMKNPNTLANCGRDQLAIGNAYLALHDVAAAHTALNKALGIASEQSRANHTSAVFRSDLARTEAALAAALAQSSDRNGAAPMYEEALKNWANLRQSKAITAEDSHRSDEAALSLAALRRSH